jgi:hypothetical protein
MIVHIWHTVQAWWQIWWGPYNRLKILNTPRTYSDPTHRAYHAVFSLLCWYVEKEYDDLDAYVEQVRQCPEDDWDWSYLFKTHELYHWYKNKDWEYEDTNDPENQKMLMEAVKNLPTWWT